MVKLAVTGFKELEQALEALGDPEAMKAAAMPAMRAALTPVRDEARALMPNNTGLTDDDIRIRAEAGGETYEGVDYGDYGNYSSGGSSKIGSLAMSVGLRGGKGGRAYIGRFHEFGTIKMKATPFLRPAFDMNVQQMLSRLKESLAKHINRQARKAKR